MAELFHINTVHNADEQGRKKTKYMIGIVALVVILGIGVLFILSYYMGNRCLDNYEVQNTVARSDSNNVNYCYFKGDLLKYSRSGISALDNNGKNLWNGGYEMKQPQIDICGDYVAVADVLGKRFYVYNGKDEGTSLETTLPIVRAKVAGQGIVAALLQDSDSNVLNIYNPYSSVDSLLVEIPTNVSEEGYPLDFDISPDGNSIVSAYMVVQGNTIENKVSFYNFTEVGQDKNTMVGGKSFGEETISRIEFVGEDEAAVFHEKGFTLFTRMKQPEVLFEKRFDEEIRSMAYSDKYIAVVTGSGEKKEKQTLHLYDQKGKEELTRDISYEFAKMDIYNEEIIFQTNHSCNIVRANGKDKFSYQFKDKIDGIFPTKNGSIYTLIDTESIKKIKLGG